MGFDSGFDIPKQHNKWKKGYYDKKTKGDSRIIIGNNLYIKGDMNKVIGGLKKPHIFDP